MQQAKCTPVDKSCQVTRDALMVRDEYQAHLRGVTALLFGVEPHMTPERKGSTRTGCISRSEMGFVIVARSGWMSSWVNSPGATR